VAAPVGVGIGFLLPPTWAVTPGDVPSMLLYEALVLSAMTLPCMVLFRDKPSVPPSASANASREENFAKSLGKLMTDRNIWVLVIEFGLSFGSFNTIATIVNQLLQPYGYSNDNAGTLGALTIFLGIVGSAVVGLIVDKWRFYKIALLACLICGCGGMIFFSLLLVPDQFALLAFAVCITGFFLTASIPVSLELSCEVAYPVGEGTISGLMTGAGNLVGIITILASNYMIDNGLVRETAWMLVACVGASCVVSCFFFGKLNRFEHDKGCEIVK
jgi:FLVCR family MFS transporter 7